MKINHLKNKKPWPTKKAMKQIYDNNLWGGGNIKYYSGEGSHNINQVKPYIDKIKVFLDSNNTKLIVCDLGCGDFNIGKQLYSYAKHYKAVDIVTDLIEYNKQNFLASNLEFSCIDIAKDPLPKADCAILRQVLQHLSNHEIEAILKKMYQYKYIILTEHIPERQFDANKDIISGQGIRLKKKSGVNIFEFPFYFKVKNKKEILKIPNDTFGGVVVTWLLEL